MNRKECPSCGDVNSRRVHVDWYRDMVEEIRVCESCPTQFSIWFEYSAVDVEEVDQ